MDGLNAEITKPIKPEQTPKSARGLIPTLSKRDPPSIPEKGRQGKSVKHTRLADVLSAVIVRELDHVQPDDEICNTASKTGLTSRIESSSERTVCGVGSELNLSGDLPNKNPMTRLTVLTELVRSSPALYVSSSCT